MTDSDEFAGLREVRRVMNDAAETLAALICVARSGELVTPEFLAIADISLAELVQCSENLRAAIGSRGDSGSTTH